jgi:hypothetical protein
MGADFITRPEKKNIYFCIAQPLRKMMPPTPKETPVSPRIAEIVLAGIIR